MTVKKGLNRDEIVSLFEGGMRQADIARKLGCQPGTITWHLMRAGYLNRRVGKADGRTPRPAKIIDPVGLAISGLHFKRELNLMQIAQLRRDVERLDAAIAALETVGAKP